MAFTPLPRHLWIIIGVAFGLRLTILLISYVANHGPQEFLWDDSPTYIRPAQTFVIDGTFTDRDRPIIIRTPGYPLFLALGVLLSHVEIYAVLMQALLGALTVSLVYRIAIAIFAQEPIALLAALAAAVEPAALLFSAMVLTETLFTFCLMLSTYLLLEARSSRALRHFAGAGAALTAAIFVRPVALYLPFVVALFLLLWALRQHASRARLLAGTALFTLIPAAGESAWILRNGIQAGFYNFTGIDELNLYFYNAAAVEAQRTHLDLGTIQRRWGYSENMRRTYYRVHPEQSSWTDGQLLIFVGSEAKRILRAHPLVYLKLHVKGMIKNLTSRGTREWFRIFHLPNSALLFKCVSAALQLFILLFYLLALIGLFAVRPQSWWTLALLLLIAFYFEFVTGGPIGDIRFRTPFMPIVCVLAGAGLATLLRRVRIPLAEAPTAPVL